MAPGNQHRRSSLQTPAKKTTDARPELLRMRSDSDFSTGSTRGALYHGQQLPSTAKESSLVKKAESKEEARSRRASRRKSRKSGTFESTENGEAQEKERPTHHRPPSMAEMADMALSLEGGLASMGATEPAVQPHTRTAASKRAALAMQHTASSKDALSETYDTVLPETELPQASLDTIPDESSSSILDESPRAMPKMADKMAKLGVQDSLRYSTRSSDAFRESQSTDASFNNRNSSILAGVNILEGFGGSLSEYGSSSAMGSRSSSVSRTPPPPAAAKRPASGGDSRALLPPSGNTSGQSYYGATSQSQQHEISMFSSFAQGDYSEGSNGESNSATRAARPPLPSSSSQGVELQKEGRSPSTEYSEELSDSTFGDESTLEEPTSFRQRLVAFFDMNPWLMRDLKIDNDGKAFFNDFGGWTPAGLVRHFLYNPVSPEFTSLQQFSWAIILGVLMGVYTAAWKFLIETGLEFTWKTVPEALLNLGLFTDVDGYFPIYHYMWLLPAVFGGILSYVFVTLPIKIPDQNEWINNVHSRGVQDYRTFGTLFILSTLGMLSGMSLGPELPLVLTAGMVGSWLGLACRQSMLQARVMNLTAASAAVGGFFGFPMAGALFVLEIPHRMGLQYFEALSPATIASIVAVLTNRLVVNNDVTGYYSYPFLTATLPSEIFTSAIVYGLFGAGVGILYALWVIKLKTLVHDLFHAPHDEHHAAEEVDPFDGLSIDASMSERSPLMAKSKPNSPLVKAASLPNTLARLRKLFCCTIPSEPHRAAVAGTIAGALCGILGMFVPHVVFWGEAQLQNLIDKGRTPLPVFGQGDEPTAALVALGSCMIDPSDQAAVRAGFSIGCSFLITTAKIVHVGLSLGTGIIGGHFWGPLFVGCSASHFLTDCVRWLSTHLGFSNSLAAYPCVVILCTMGAAHVVTFRAHMAIMLILTLTISAFDPEDDSSGGYGVAGDYSAVFPLLVVSVFVSLMVSRETIFYKSQRNRGDIVAVPEVLCEPGLEGRPIVVDYDKSDFSSSAPSDEDDSRGFDSDVELARSISSKEHGKVRTIPDPATDSDIEKDFMATLAMSTSRSPVNDNVSSSGPSRTPLPATITPPLPPAAKTPPLPQALPPSGKSDADKRLDELLSKPLEQPRPPRGRMAHRRIQSAPIHVRSKTADGQLGAPTSKKPEMERIDSFRFDAPARERSNSNSSRGNLVRIDSFGEIEQHQPSLLDQARMRAATSVVDTRHRRIPSLPSSARHSRKNSDASAATDNPGLAPPSSALGMDDMDKAFRAAFSPNKSPWTNNSGKSESSSVSNGAPSDEELK